MKTCYFCGEEHEESEMRTVEVNGREVEVSDDCFDERYFICPDCEDIIERSNAVMINPGTKEELAVCEYCADHNYYKCEDCGDYVDEDHLAMDDGSTYICHNCESRWVRCYDCGNVIKMDDAHYRDADGEWYCKDCICDYDDDDCLEDYGYKPYDYDPIFWKTADDSSDEKLFFGIEQETDSGRCRYDYVQALSTYSKDGELFIMKDDCSLENGVEIVSYPCSFKYLMEEYPFEEIREVAREHRYVAHDSGNCGLHIHVSRAGLGETSVEQDLVVAKIMILYDRFWDNIVKFSRRKNTNWCHKPDANITEEDTQAVAIEKSKKNRWSHSMAVNLQHYNTVEFRIFRGTLNVDTMKASIQFVKTMVDWAMKHSLNECQEVTWKDLTYSSYTELNNYLVARGLN